MIIHPESCSVLFKLKHPELVRKVLPKGSKDINIDGHNIAVRFTLDAMKVLRNMGIKAPLPIRYNYGWPRPAHFKDVFEHQIITAEMLTLHHRMFVLNEMGCVDANTEYLSPTGWRRIDEYDGGMVAQYDKRTGEGSFVQPTEYVKYPCEEMIRFKTSRGVDQLLSTEHRVAYVGSTGQFTVQSAQEIESAYFQSGRGWSGRFITTFKGTGGDGVPDSDAQIRLQVAVIADGYFDKATNWCVVRVKKERKKLRLRELLDACGVVYKETMPEYKGAEGFSVFRFNAPVREKEFGARWWDASPAQLSVITDEVWRWDGSVRKAGAVDFCSTSKASADFVQYAFSACGRTTTLGTTRSGRKRPLHVVHAQNDGKLRYLKGTTSSGVKKPNVWREPSPDGHKYCFEVPKTFLVMRRNGCVFITGNTSKTASALWAADYLMLNGFVGKCLIVAPLSTLDLVWANEIFSVLMHRTCAVLHGSREKRMELLARDFPFYIINHDGLKIIQPELRRRKDINLIIVDESSVYRNSGTERYKVLEESIQPWHRLWLMTGAPCPNAPTDAWAQARLVNPTRVPKYFGQFRRQTMYQVTQYKWAARPEAYQTVFDAMQPAVRFKKSECLSLPPVTVTNRQSKITAEQAAAFHAMKKEAAAEVAAGIPIMAANAADKINKLRQILCIASGTLILTPNGWKEIQTLTTDEHVWDGLTWVRHGGVLCNGIQPVVTLDGVRMTKEHEVLTRSGWQTAECVLNDQSSYRFDRASFWIPDCFAPARNDGRGIAKSNVAMPMLLRKYSSSGEPEPPSKKSSERKALRMSAQVHQLQAPHVIHQALSSVERPETAMHRPYGQRLEKLWRAGNNGLQRVVGQLQQFLVRHAGRLLSDTDAGPARQREGVQQRELQVGDSGTAGQQYTAYTTVEHPEGANDIGACVKKLRPEDSDTVLPIEGGMVGGESTSDSHPEMALVFDIKDCGPRNRFVVQGADGMCFIVHNCGVVKDTATGDYVEIPHHPRIETLMECIEQAAAKVLVIVPFKGIIHAIDREVRKTWKCAIVNGDVSRVARTAIFNQFKNDPDLKVLLCHPKVMAHGITATEADMIVFYAPIYSNDEAQQVTERINRPGQTRNMTIVRIGASSVEWAIYNMVEGKRVGQESILELYKKELQGIG